MLLSSIFVYPIKSFDGVSLDRVDITPGGFLRGDRIYALVDGEGKVVNAKRTGRIQLIRSKFSPDFREVTLWLTGDEQTTTFSIFKPDPLNAWLSDFFGFPVKLVQDEASGFPDDREAFGPTIVSEASLQTVSTWYSQMSFESARRRFRTNLEIADVPSFWEDHLFGKPKELKLFTIGNVQLFGHNPCQRCVVPTRDPERATPQEQFQKTFMELRKKHLPPWSNAERFNHYYRFAINTSIPPSEAGKVLQVGDRIIV